MKHIRYFIPILFLIFSFSLSAQESLWKSGRPDGHAPIGVMGDHTHGKGEFMLSYRLMRMEMEGMRSVTEELSTDQVLSPEGENFLVTPLSMPMNMHMIGGMYAVSDELTFMAMVNLLEVSMDHQTRMGGNFTTNAQGLGDMRINGMYKFFDNKRQRMHINLGVNIPTGDIDAQDITPASAPNKAQLPYPMQLGTGTFDLLPGLTYLGQTDNGSWGAQALGAIRLGENEREYSQGNQLEATSWLAYKLNVWVSTSLRVRGLFRGEIQGADPTFDGPVMMRMVPTVFPGNFGGSTVFAGGGFNFFVPSGALKDLRIAIEVEAPIWQELNGPQLETDFVLTVGAQYAF